MVPCSQLPSRTGSPPRPSWPLGRRTEPGVMANAGSHCHTPVRARVVFRAMDWVGCCARNATPQAGWARRTRRLPWSLAAPRSSGCPIRMLNNRDVPTGQDTSSTPESTDIVEARRCSAEWRDSTPKPRLASFDATAAGIIKTRRVWLVSTETIQPHFFCFSRLSFLGVRRLRRCRRWTKGKKNGPSEVTR